MVTHLNIALDDDAAERVRSVKEDLGLTWAEFLVEAADALENGREMDLVADVGELNSSEKLEQQMREDSADVNDDSLVTDLDLPGSGDTLERRRAAVQRLYDHLRENGTARRRDFLDLVDADKVDYSSAKSFWSNCIKDRDALHSLPGVDPPGEGEHTWRYES